MKRTMTVGAVAVGAGLVLVALSVVHATLLRAAYHPMPQWLVAAVGCLLVLVGLVLALGERLPRTLVSLLGCLYLTLFSAVTAWVGFGAGGERYARSLSAPYLLAPPADSAVVGRWIFALASAGLAALALLAWTYWLRLACGPLRRAR